MDNLNATLLRQQMKSSEELGEDAGGEQAEAALLRESLGRQLTDECGRSRRN